MWTGRFRVGVGIYIKKSLGYLTVTSQINEMQITLISELSKNKQLQKHI